MEHRASIFTPVLLVGCFIMLLSFAVRASFGVFQIPIAEEFGWARAEFSLAIAIQNLFWGIGQPIFGAIADEMGGKGFDWATKAEDRTALWKMRHNASYAILASRPGARALVTDLCVPISMLAEAINETVADIDTSFLTGPIVGHVGDGNFHSALLIEDGNARDLEEALRLSDRMVDRALRMGGTVTGEHGVGMGKMKYMEREHGGGWDVMGQIKRAMDPQNILNPGKLVRGN